MILLVIFNSKMVGEGSGQPIDQALPWDVVHKKKDGSYVNDEAKEIAVRSHLKVLLLSYYHTIYLTLLILCKVSLKRLWVKRTHHNI